MSGAIVGTTELYRKLRQIRPEILRELTPVMAKSANELASTAKALVPRGPGPDHLADTIEGHVVDGGRGFEVTAGGDTVDSKIQAHAVEGGRRSSAKTGGMDARPYLNPAKRLMAKRIRGRINRGINKALKKVAGNG